MSGKQKKALGESLVEEGIITAEQLKQAKTEEKRSGLRLRKALVKTGLITEEDLVMFLSGKLGIPRIELGSYLIDSKVTELVSEDLARKYELIPIFKIGNRLTCAMVDPWNVFALDEIRLKTNLIIEPAVATEAEIKKALDEHYGAKGTMEDVIKSIDEKGIGAKDGKEIDLKELEGIAEEPVVIKLVNLIIMKAVREGASDIHIEPEEDTLKTRFRVDGVLHEVSASPKHLQSAIISRIKIMANLDIAERRAPQDGRFTLKMEGREIDIRVSCMPTIYGENVVLRILDVSSALLDFKDTGFSEDILEKYQKLIFHPHGMILVTGPTGCGKTTTLYVSLDKINTVEKNIITIEDPVEYKLSGIRQMQVNPKVDLTFANGLRSMLRQDPDVIMVGEIRDFQTAEIAIHAALTGHLVFSTLHTNDAAGALTRMIDMGVEPFLVSSSLIAVLAQRLVRTICKDCKEEYTPTEETMRDIGLLDERRIKFYRGKGCSKCMNTGYKGRIGIFELMPIDENIRKLTIARAPHDEVKKQAIASGMITLKQDGIKKVKEGITTVEEMLRVIQEE
ncbi:MAG: type II secretion system ATPase GspE [Candidatus Omnitrophica bacterium]|nr:type II secretion system ATPase GspE [Candidatus Omnitrophota bacterium]MBU1933073.1 type II secretion system ATPase GspE [Candidatus Omnitrophota bacterium]